MTDTCKQCAKVKFGHLCPRHAPCMNSDRKQTGGLKWDPEKCDLCTKWLAGFRKDQSYQSELTMVLRLVKQHRQRSHMTGEELLDFFSSISLRDELLHLVPLAASSNRNRSRMALSPEQVLLPLSVKN